MKRTPEQILADKKRTNLTGLLNRISSAISFKQVKTWRDVYKMEGRVESDYGGNADSPITYPEFKVYAQKLKDELEAKLSWQSINPPSDHPIPALTTPAPALDLTTPQPHEPLQPIPEPVIEEQSLTDSNDYGLVKSPNEKAFLYWFQKSAIKSLLDGMLGIDTSRFKTTEELKVWYQANKHLIPKDLIKLGQLLLSATGTGKTFIIAGLYRRLVDIGFADGQSFGSTMYLYVTKSTIVEQTKRVFEKYFGLTLKEHAVEIINIEQLRSKAGTLWCVCKKVVVNGEEEEQWEWRRALNPVVVAWDESQGLKNEGSVQHQIGCAFNEIKTPTRQVMVSATPFTKVSEAKCFAVSTRKVISDIIGLSHQSILTNENWPTYSSSISAPSLPTEYNEAAVERFVKDMEAFIVRVRGVRSQFNAINRIERISFETPDEKAYYDDTEARYFREKAKLEADLASGAEVNGFLLHLVLMNKRCMAAEFCRKRQLARRMFNATKEGYAAVCAVKYKQTLIGVVRILCEEFGVSRDSISLVWGGGGKKLTKKEKTKGDIVAKAQQLAAAGLDVNELFQDLDLEETDVVMEEELPAHLRLGSQSREERQVEIDKFQSGRTLYCIYTFKAGGVGLSLHHSDELTKYKCKRKASGYAVEEDIPNVPVRPRINFVAPTYSAIELVQGLGRCPRLTSLSDTQQFLLFYRGTIEDEVAEIVKQKLRCLSKVVRQREAWSDVLVDAKTADRHKHSSDGLADDNADDLTEPEESEEE